MRTAWLVGVVVGLVGCGGGGSDDEFGGAEPVGTVQLELDGALEVGGGDAYSCALRSNGQVTCWGATASTLPFSDYVEIAPGAHHLCALRANGSVICQWVDSYYNAFGELNAPAATPMADLSAGLQVTCGIRSADHAIQCWGRNDHGQAEPPPGQYERIEMGWSHGCAVRMGEPGVDCWGLNVHGQANGFGAEVADLAAGAYHTCYIRAADNLTTCSNGGAVPWANDYVQISAGLQHTCGVTASGEARCWGDNSYGQGGFVGGWTAFVGAGANHTCRTRLRTNLVMCWGNDSDGQTSPPP